MHGINVREKSNDFVSFFKPLLARLLAKARGYARGGGRVNYLYAMLTTHYKYANNKS